MIAGRERVPVLTLAAPGGTDRAAARARELAVLMRTRLSYYDVSAPGSVLAR